MEMELLSPAGDMERLRAAILYGADAVYLGATEFGMRAAPANFTPEQLAQAVQFAHSRGVKVYLTVNTLPRPDEAAALPDFLRSAADAGVDALIVADLGVLALARRLLPEMALRASTQTGIVNHLTARALYEMGVTTVVLARELTLEEIAAIREQTPPELTLEAFVHGSMCMSVSGRCVISDYLTGRNANRGECTQPCRWSYHLMEEKRPGIYLPVFEDEHGSTILSAKDLCMIEHLDDLARVGIRSLKIEGRGKSIYYTAAATNAYRAALDAFEAGTALPAWAAQELDKISHREYSTGFYYGRKAPQQTNLEGGYVQDWEISAVVERCEQGRLFLSQRNRFFAGDTLELMRPGCAPCPVEVNGLCGEEGALEQANHPQMQVSIPFEGEAEPGAMLRRRLK